MANRLHLGGEILLRTPEVIVQIGTTTGSSTGSDLLLRRIPFSMVAWGSFPMTPNSLLVFSEISWAGLHCTAPLTPSAAYWSPGDRLFWQNLRSH